MKSHLLTIYALLIGVLLASIAPQMPSAMAAPSMTEDTGGHPAREQLLFIANVGQLDAKARFQVRGQSAGLFLADDALWLTVVDARSLATAHRRATTPASQPTPPDELMRAVSSPTLRGVSIKLSFVGANTHPRLEPFDRLDTHLSFFQGDQASWHADVPVWGGVRYRELYPGIDLELSGARGQLEQRVRARPGADLSAVRLRVDGVSSQRVEGDYLRMQTAVGDVSMPLLHIEADGAISLAPSEATPAVEGREVRAPFVWSAYRSGVAAAQSALGVGYGTLLGGAFDDSSWAIAVDGSDATYVTGETFSPDFPTTPGAFDLSCGVDGTGKCDYDGNLYYYDAFVAKLNGTGTALIYATFLGGSLGDFGYGIAIDQNGAAYITGETFSENFPTTPNAFDKTCGADGHCSHDSSGNYADGFVVKLNPTGSALDYATYLGHANYDWGTAIAVDGNGAAYITGVTYSPNFPTTSGAFDRVCGTDDACSYDSNTNTVRSDAFIAKLNATGTSLIYSTFVGGSNYDNGYGIAVDQNGLAYITGNSTSDDFPTTSGAFDTQCGTDNACNPDNGSVYYDTFVTKVNATGTALVYSTYLGGSNGDGGYGIAIDPSGAAYVTGYTFSDTGFPISPGAYDSSFNGLDDGFVAKLSPAGSSLIYATFLGGSDGDTGRSIAIDADGNAYIAGLTFSSGFPTTSNGYDASFNGADDAFVVKLNPTGTELAYATFLGGSDTDEAYGIALTGSDIIYVTGLTSSASFPVTQGAYDTHYEGNTCGTDPDSHPCYDAFVVKLAPLAGPPPQNTRVFLPLASYVIVTTPPPPSCDDLEPNDDRRTNPRKLEAGQPIQAKICANDQDNYSFDITRNAKPAITLDLPPALRGKTLIWVYNQTKLDTTICGNGDLAASPRIAVTNCGVLSPGRYIVRLYTDNSATDFDNQNPYTLLVAY